MLARLFCGALLCVIACGDPTAKHHATDAAVDAAPTYEYSISTTAIDASPLVSHVVTVTGYPGDEVSVTVDRPSAGSVDASTVQLDATGTGTVTFTPCSWRHSTCLGSATFSMSLAATPTVSVATATTMLQVPTEVGDVTPCQTNANVAYMKGNDGLLNGTYHNAPLDPWEVNVSPDYVRFNVGNINDGQYQGAFSLVELAKPLTPGTYDNARRASSELPDHPGLEIGTPGLGCNQLDGRFQVHEYVADPEDGSIRSVTISFEQWCDVDPATSTKYVIGCFHYGTPAPPPPPPPPDPTKVSVEVFSLVNNNTPDSTAIAIFTDANGNVVSDATVDAHGRAEASLPTGGTLTIVRLKPDTFDEEIRSYRGVVNGDHIVVGANPRGDKPDLMHANYSNSATAVFFTTPCGYSTHNKIGRATLAFYDGCRTPTFNMLAVRDGTPNEFIWQTNATHVPNGNVLLTGTWSPMTSAALTLENVNIGGSLSVRWYTLVGKVAHETDAKGLAPPDVGTSTIAMRHAAGAGDGTVVNIDVNPSLLANESRRFVSNTNVSAVTIDFAAQPTPNMSALQQTATGATWTQTQGNADRRTVFWRAQTPNWRTVWVLIEPNDGQSSTTLPALPSARAALDPTLTATELKGTAVTYDDYDTVSAYSIADPSGTFHQHTTRIQTWNMQF